jgi:DhnA family fructose-bisphosphate aldolase class Ia
LLRAGGAIDVIGIAGGTIRNLARGHIRTILIAIIGDRGSVGLVLGRNIHFRHLRMIVLSDLTDLYIAT